MLEGTDFAQYRIALGRTGREQVRDWTCSLPVEYCLRGLVEVQFGHVVSQVFGEPGFGGIFCQNLEGDVHI